MTRRGLSHIDNAGRNKNIILNAIREQPALSRREVALGSSLSLSTTKRLIEELLGEELLEEVPAERARGVRGPKAGNLRLRRGFGYALGLNIELEHIEACAVNLSGEVLRLESHRLRDRGSEATIRQLVEVASALRRDLEASPAGRLLGLGVAIAGLVDARRGFIYDCFPIPGWENVNLKDRLQAELSAAVLVDDRVRSMALGEKRYGVARELETFLYIDVGNGVGSCFFLDNRIYRGKNGISGEFGHIPVKENGPQCNCGNKGCLEVLVSTGSILAAVQNSLRSNVYTQLKGGGEAGPPIDLPDIARAAGEGDKLASLVVFDTAELIGIGLADLVSVFDPGTIILAGEVVRGLGPLLVEGIVRTVRLRGIHPITQRTQFLTGSGIQHMGAWGAATMPLEHWFGSGILNV
jgi:predicted NBD/HSP70 family sugar kinase